MADQRNSKRSPRTTHEQRVRVIDQFKQSQLTQTAFARRHGIAMWNLSRWLAESKRRSKPAPRMVFSEVKLVPPLALSPPGWAMEMVGTNGLTIRCREALPIGELAGLLRN